MFDSRYYDRLGRLRLAVEKKSNAALIGSRKSVRKGSSAEFSDFREYMPGDDVRSIDWNAYARLDRLYIKEYMEEKESRVHIFLDTSRSMDYGERKKSELALELTAALSYISLMSMDHVVIYDLADMSRRHVARGGRAGYRDLQQYLERLPVSDSVEVYPALRLAGQLQPGLSILVTDFLGEEFLSKEGEIEQQDTLAQILKYLRFMKQNTVLLHVLAKEETDIAMSGTCNLIDMEHPESKLRVTMERDAIRVYLDGLQRFMDALLRTARRYGATYHPCNTGDPFDRIVFEELRDVYER